MARSSRSLSQSTSLKSLRSTSQNTNAHHVPMDKSNRPLRSFSLRLGVIDHSGTSPRPIAAATKNSSSSPLVPQLQTSTFIIWGISLRGRVVKALFMRTTSRSRAYSSTSGSPAKALKHGSPSLMRNCRSFFITLNSSSRRTGHILNGIGWCWRSCCLEHGARRSRSFVQTISERMVGAFLQHHQRRGSPDHQESRQSAACPCPLRP